VVSVTKANGTIDYIPSKVHITGLLAGTDYYYRACPGNCEIDIEQSRGKFRTPHANGKHGLRFGVSSCWRGDMKPFISIRNVPNRDLDFFVALGDTVYADSNQGNQRPVSTNPERYLEKFRATHNRAYSQLHSPDDNMLALARASTAFYVDIDDHEIVNNFAGGAKAETQQDSPECRDWKICFCNDDSCKNKFINNTKLYKDAMQAWHEYNPVNNILYPSTLSPRMANKDKLYRYRTFGKDAALFMLDARSFRDEESVINVYDDSRTMLGKAQLQDLKDDLVKADDSSITWKIVLIPEPMQNLDPIAAADRFEGYAYERGELLHYIEEKGIANVVFISGDIHGTIVNNLTYKRSLADPQRFSASWDISTGPGAYSEPLGHTFTRVGPLAYDEPGDEARHKALDLAFWDVFSNVLYLANAPGTGLGPEIFRIPPLQQYNRSVPSTLESGSSYVATHTYGWTEFEIDDASQALTVTTYGIDWYEPFSYVDGNGESQFRPPTQQEVSALQKRNQYTVSKFTVEANFEENESFCVRDVGCASGLCNAGICTSPQANDQPCVRDVGCLSGVCNGVCIAPNSVMVGDLCFGDTSCRSGRCAGICLARCGDGWCEGTEQCGGNDTTLLQCRSDCGRCANHSACGDDNMCASGLCNLGICTSPQADGQPCLRDKGCVSRNCRFGFCRP
jgi:phosphodiesterase/alkaline phosphatase D-like protein